MLAHRPASVAASTAAARRSKAAAARTSAPVATRRPSPSHGSSETTPPYLRGPASARPSAPASAASGQPAFGERCLAASRRMTRHAARRHDTMHSSAPVRRAGNQFAASSSRAADWPNAAYRGVRWPNMLSSVLTALYAASPGRPRSAYQNSGATTPSLRFSPADSIAARATAPASRLSGSRPTIRRTRARAASTPESSARAVARTSSCRPRHAISVLAAAASTSHPHGSAWVPRAMSQPATAAARTRPAASPAPRSALRPPQFNLASSAPATRPKAATGCGTARYRRGGSPTAVSIRKASKIVGGAMSRPCAHVPEDVKPGGAGQ